MASHLHSRSWHRRFWNRIRHEGVTLLASLVVELVAVGDTIIPQTHGRFLQALFLDIVRSVAPSCSEAMHAGSEVRPYTVSPLRFPAPVGRDASRARPEPGRSLVAGSTCHLRLTLLNDQLADVVIAGLIASRSPGAPVRVGQAIFEIGAVRITPGTDDWVASTTFMEIEAHSTVDYDLTFALVAPCMFRLGGGARGLYPTPELIFGNLVSRWNAFSPRVLDPSAVASVASSSLVTAFSVETRMVDFGRFREPGTVGWVRVTLPPDSDELQRRTMNVLADYAFYAGLGARTTMGMGQARRMASARGIPPTSRTGTARTVRYRDGSGALDGEAKGVPVWRSQ